MRIKRKNTQSELLNTFAALRPGVRKFHARAQSRKEELDACLPIRNPQSAFRNSHDIPVAFCNIKPPSIVL